MTTITLNNTFLYNSFIIGAKNVILEKNSLNKINVFPVPDGDTGTNLSSMMNSIIEKAILKETSLETMETIVDAAIEGARGNSGIIFASYINGFYNALKNDELTIDQYIEMVTYAADQAYLSINKPVEGTMITLMRVWATALNDLKDVSKGALDLFSQAFAILQVELKNTTEKLAVLKQNKVVDAGAKGFVHFIEGFIKSLKGEQVSLEFHDIPEITEQLHIDHLDESQFRYCTEALLSSSDIDHKAIKSHLETLGDSLVVAGNKRRLRVHIHTDVPDQVFTYLASHGTILEQKVDDMIRQFEMVNHQKYNIALVCDSIADLPQSLVDQYQIHQYPLGLMINGTTYYDKLTIQSGSFYDLMDTLDVYPTTSQPNQKSLENFFSQLTTYYDKIIVLSVSSKMSGTYQAFVDAAAKFKDKKIAVIDTMQNSGAQGLLVLKTAQAIEKKMDFDKIVDYINTLKQETKILVSVKTLKYMVKNGRVSKTTGLIGKIVNLKPVISIDNQGEGIIFDKGLSIKTSNKKIFNHVKGILEFNEIEDYAIVHANADDRAQSYTEVYTDLIGKPPTYIMNISPIVALSAGIGTVAIAYVKGKSKLADKSVN
ncbi:MAG: DegV family EDD domain-containing protein [Acholeplasmataceae bacterium]|nr:DegV family EDD domain-containing protein [Acholeplasmataceae bacterium]